MLKSKSSQPLMNLLLLCRIVEVKLKLFGRRGAFLKSFPPIFTG